MDRESGSSPVISWAAWHSEGDLIRIWVNTMPRNHKAGSEIWRKLPDLHPTIWPWQGWIYWLAGWLSDHPKVRRNWSSVCDSVHVEAIPEIWCWVTWPTFKTKTTVLKHRPKIWNSYKFVHSDLYTLCVWEMCVFPKRLDVNCNLYSCYPPVISSNVKTLEW